MTYTSFGRFIFLSALLITTSSSLNYPKEAEIFTSSVGLLFVPSHSVQASCWFPDEDGMTVMEIDIKLKDYIVSFGWRRGWNIETCHQDRDEILDILRKNDFVYIAGSSGSLFQLSREEREEVYKYNEFGQKSFIDSTKLNLSYFYEYIYGENVGCHSYFKGKCDFSPHSAAFEISNTPYTHYGW
jgi:hypothetical protein